MNEYRPPNPFDLPFPSPTEIGARLRMARRARGWTIAEMAAKGGIKAVVIGSYERGSRVMPYTRLGELARILNINIESLIGYPTSRENSGQPLVIDLRALSKIVSRNQERLILLRNYCASIARKRGDWNGEVLTLRGEDLTILIHFSNIEAGTYLQWLKQERIEFKGLNRS